MKLDMNHLKKLMPEQQRFEIWNYSDLLRLLLHKQIVDLPIKLAGGACMLGMDEKGGPALFFDEFYPLEVELDRMRRMH